MSSTTRCIPRSARRRLLRLQQPRPYRGRATPTARFRQERAIAQALPSSITDRISLSVSAGTAAALMRTVNFHFYNVEEFQ